MQIQTKPLLLLICMFNCLFFACNETLKEPVPLEQDVILRSQLDVDKFLMEHVVVNQIKGNLTIGLTNSDIVTLKGLKNIESVSGDLNISSNLYLENLIGLERLKTVGGDLRISNNQSLTNIEEINALTKIGSNLIIDQNEILNSLRGLSNVKSVNGAVFISSNPSLKTLDGLESIQIIKGRLQITNHHSLEDISALNGLTGIYSTTNSIADVLIYHNPKLSKCSVRSICNALLDGKLFSDIENNSTGCNNRNEIISSCISGVDGVKYMKQLKGTNNLLKNEVLIESDAAMNLFILNEKFEILETFAMKKGDNRVEIKDAYQGIIYLRDENGKIRYITKQ